MDGATQPAHVAEVVELTKREMDLEKDLDVLDYQYRDFRNKILNELARIRMRQGELLRLHGKW